MFATSHDAFPYPVWLAAIILALNLPPFLTACVCLRTESRDMPWRWAVAVGSVCVLGFSASLWHCWLYAYDDPYPVGFWYEMRAGWAAIVRTPFFVETVGGAFLGSSLLTLLVLAIRQKCCPPTK